MVKSLFVVLFIGLIFVQSSSANYDLSLILPDTYSTFVGAANNVNVTPATLPALYTLFVPINSAFERLGCLSSISHNKTMASLIIRYHFIKNPHDYTSVVTTATVKNPWTPQTLDGSNAKLSLAFNVSDTLVSINERSWIIAPDMANYGVLNVHGIDTVLIPPGVKMPLDCNYY